ncbi:recombinase family protein [Skermanella rosea]|nr:recombinase family protein [Skermanella rosea]
MRELKTRGMTLKATEQPIDTASTVGKAFLDMSLILVESEAILRKERQFERITRAKAEGTHTGRKATLDFHAIKTLKAQDVEESEIARKLGFSRGFVYHLFSA